MKPIIVALIIVMALPANAEEYVIEVGELILDCGSKCPTGKKAPAKAKKKRARKTKKSKPALAPQVKASAPKAKVETVKKPAAVKALAPEVKPAPVTPTVAVAPAVRPCDDSCKKEAADAFASAAKAKQDADRAKAETEKVLAFVRGVMTPMPAAAPAVPYRTFHLAATIGVAGAFGTTAGDGGMAPLAISLGWWLNDRNLIAVQGYAQRNFAAKYKEGVWGYGGSIRYLHEVHENIRLGAQVGPEFLTANAGSGEGEFLQLLGGGVAQFKWEDFIIELSVEAGARLQSHYLVGRTGAKAIESGPVGKVGIAFGWSHDFLSGNSKKKEGK